MKRLLILPLLAISLIAGTTTAVAADAPTTPEPTPTAPVLPTPPTLKDGSWTARVLFPANARSKPGAGKVVMKLKHYAPYTQGPNVFMVTDATMVGEQMWVQVQLPKRPNGTRGWISEDALELTKIHTWIRVSVGTRKVLVFKNGKRIKSFGAAVGTGGTPTPVGLFAVNDAVPTSGELAPFIFVLTAHSNVLKTFAGGNGVVGIHGWPSSNVLGKAVSHGCVRMSRAGARALARFATPGTPVEIVK
jgi:lipoprotein-anchoring transpeptidase ErfK/SrfK